jgi:NADH-quinone oxidoreductase subunit A
MSPYIWIVILLAIASGLRALTINTSVLVGARRYNRAKLDSYECGIEPTPQPVGGGRFPVKYYITAMLFIVFDIEIVFLYPWAVSFDQMGTFALVEMGSSSPRCSSRTSTCCAAAAWNGIDSNGL